MMYCTAFDDWMMFRLSVIVSVGRIVARALRLRGAVSRYPLGYGVCF